MATCRICGNEVAEDAEGCVVCGIKNPVAKPKKPGGLKRALWWTFAGVFLLPIAGLLALVILFGIVSLFSDGDEDEVAKVVPATESALPPPMPKPEPEWNVRPFKVVHDDDISIRNRLRRRVTISAPEARTPEDRIATAMQAATQAWRKHKAQFISVFVLPFEGGPPVAQIDYATDKCGVSGEGSDCTGKAWTDAKASAGNMTADQLKVYKAWEANKDAFKELDADLGFERVNEARLKAHLGDQFDMTADQVGQAMIDALSVSYGKRDMAVPFKLVLRHTIRESELKAAEDVACRHSLQCWGDRHHVNATVTCQYIIEGMARYAHEWTDSWLESKFPRFAWDDKDAGTLKYGGNKVRFQNGFGAWQNMSYWCTYDPNTERAAAEVFN